MQKGNIMKKNKIKKFLNDYMKWTPSTIVILVVLSIPFLLFFVMPFKLNNDFWFLINTGKYIINNGIPHTEPFTIHSNLSFVAQQWLTDVIFYLIYNKFNIYGMYIFILISNIVIVFLLYKLALLISNKVKVSMITTSIIDIMLVIVFVTTRPQVFDIILLILELYLLELYIKKNNKKYLIGLPIISLLMINLHASVWPMIFVFLLPYYVGRINLKFNNKENYKLKPLIIVTIVTFIFGFINPYGIEAMIYLFNSYEINQINNLVGEMKPLTINNGKLIYIYILFIITTYIINKNSKINFRYMLLLLGTTLLSLQHVKGELFFLISSILIVNYNLKDSFIEEKNSNNSNKYLNIILLFIVFMISIVLISNQKFIGENEHYLHNLSDILKENATSDDLIYTGYDEGGYIEYQGFKCYIDPRAEVFLKSNNKQKDIFIEYYNLRTGVINYKDFLNTYNFDYLVVAFYENILFTYIDESKNYTLIYNENNKLKLYKKIEE